MMESPETRVRVGTGMMVVGALLTITIIGMAFGIPFFMWGWDMKNRAQEDLTPSH